MYVIQKKSSTPPEIVVLVGYYDRHRHVRFGWFSRRGDDMNRIDAAASMTVVACYCCDGRLVFS